MEKVDLFFRSQKKVAPSDEELQRGIVQFLKVGL